MVAGSTAPRLRVGSTPRSGHRRPHPGSPATSITHWNVWSYEDSPVSRWRTSSRHRRRTRFGNQARGRGATWGLMDSRLWSTWPVKWFQRC